MFRIMSSLPSDDHIYHVGVVIGSLCQSNASLMLDILRCICLVFFLHMNFETEITAIVKGIMFGFGL